MAMSKTAFTELVAALVDEVSSVGRRPTYQVDYNVRQPQSIAASHAEHDAFGRIADGLFQDESPVLVEDWLEAQLLDCQNLARRQGFAKLASILDEALDALVDERQGSGGSPPDWQIRSQQ